MCVRVIGLEPTRLTAPDPKSGAAANYATPARDFPILKSFKSGATREINGNRTGAY